MGLHKEPSWYLSGQHNIPHPEEVIINTGVLFVQSSSSFNITGTLKDLIRNVIQIDNCYLLSSLVVSVKTVQ